MCQKCIKEIEEEQKALKETLEALHGTRNHVAFQIRERLKKVLNKLEEEKIYHISQMN